MERNTTRRPAYDRCDDCGRNAHKVAARVNGRVRGYCPSCWESQDHTGTDVVYDKRRRPADAHGLFARTQVGNFRVGGWSSWKNAQRRFNAATGNGARTAVEVHAFVDGRWQNFTGHLAVRSADDPAFTYAAVANKRDVSMGATVRAADYRKVR